MQEGSKLQGLHVIRLLQWFVLPPDERDTYEYASYVLANIAQVCGSPSLSRAAVDCEQLQSGRNLLMDKDRGQALAATPRVV